MEGPSQKPPGLSKPWTRWRGSSASQERPRPPAADSRASARPQSSLRTGSVPRVLFRDAGARLCAESAWDTATSAESRPLLSLSWEAKREATGGRPVRVEGGRPARALPLAQVSGLLTLPVFSLFSSGKWAWSSTDLCVSSKRPSEESSLGVAPWRRCLPCTASRCLAQHLAHGRYPSRSGGRLLGLPCSPAHGLAPRNPPSEQWACVCTMAPGPGCRPTC